MKEVLSRWVHVPNQPTTGRSLSLSLSLQTAVIVRVAQSGAFQIRPDCVISQGGCWVSRRGCFTIGGGSTGSRTLLLL